LKVNRRFGGIYLFHLQGRRISQKINQLDKPSDFSTVSCLAYIANLMMEVTFSSKTSVGFPRTTWRYIPHENKFFLIMDFASVRDKIIYGNLYSRNISFKTNWISETGALLRISMCALQVSNWGTTPIVVEFSFAPSPNAGTLSQFLKGR
jgi:hypothetical protein